MLELSKLKEFADDNFKHDEISRKFSKMTENTLGKKEKLLVMSFSHSVFKEHVLQTCKGFVWETVNFQRVTGPFCLRIPFGC